MTLYFSVLYCSPSKSCIKLYSFDSSGSSFILKNILSNPKVYVIQKSTSFTSSYLQDDVRITRVEFTIIRFWQRNWLKILNSPDLSPSAYSYSLKCRFQTFHRARHCVQ
nr:hypothetical protein Iba_scaffold38056CG0010 [Ipomoea batatas]